MTFDEFRTNRSISVEDVCRNYYSENKGKIKIKKEHVVIKNMSIIMNTTLKLSMRMGFDAMSLRDLSAETGLSMGALYSYISSKDELLALLHRYGQKTIKKNLEAMVDGITEPRKKLDTFIRSHIFLSELLREWFYFFFMETKNLGKKNRLLPMESELMTEQMCTHIIEEGQAKGVFADVRTDLTGAGIKALMQDWYLKRWKYSRRGITPDAYADFIIGFIEKSILL